jgi:hypothetical protein
MTKVGNRHFFEGCEDGENQNFKSYVPNSRFMYTVLQVFGKYYKLQISFVMSSFLIGNIFET